MLSVLAVIQVPAESKVPKAEKAKAESKAKAKAKPKAAGNPKESGPKKAGADKVARGKKQQPGSKIPKGLSRIEGPRMLVTARGLRSPISYGKKWLGGPVRSQIGVRRLPAVTSIRGPSIRESPFRFF